MQNHITAKTYTCYQLMQIDNFTLVDYVLKKTFQQGGFWTGFFFQTKLTVTYIHYDHNTSWSKFINTKTPVTKYVTLQIGELLALFAKFIISTIETPISCIYLPDL